ncbi:MAG: FAD-binding protein [Chloroflexi bacterium]|nr:FAD-binding protein [Chloroflexota bacterium]
MDESWYEPRLPEVVVWPSNTEQVAAVLRYANERLLPVSPWSGGSSLEGNPIPTRGGIVLAMYRMNKLLEVREDDMQVVVQPGIVYDELNAQIKRLGLYLPTAPGSADVATIGGMVSNNSSGMRAIKYGVTRNYVLKLKVVLPNGEVLTLGSNAKKTTSGYDLLGLFVGSEGTLGVVTEITLRVIGLPEKIAAAVAVFDNLGDAANTIHDCVRYSVDPSALELMDEALVRLTNRQHNLSLPEKPLVFVEFNGNEGAIEEQMDYLKEICEDNHCTQFLPGMTTQEREKVWKARQVAHDTIKFSHAGWRQISGDVCVPISRFTEMVEFTHDLSAKEGVELFVFGHAGDGNLHTDMVVPPDDPVAFATAMRVLDAVIARALDVGGTIAGEHGIGLGKRHFMVREHGPSLTLMRAIKGLIDPNGIMNPDKMLPEAS